MARFDGNDADTAQDPSLAPFAGLFGEVGFGGAGQWRFAQLGGDTLAPGNADADPEAELALLLRGLVELTANDPVCWPCSRPSVDLLHA